MRKKCRVHLEVGRMNFDDACLIDKEYVKFLDPCSIVQNICDAYTNKNVHWLSRVHRQIINHEALNVLAHRLGNAVESRTVTHTALIFAPITIGRIYWELILSFYTYKEFCQSKAVCRLFSSMLSYV